MYPNSNSQGVAFDVEALKLAELNRHNYYRSFHRVPLLIIDNNLNSVAQGYANFLANAHNGLTHSQGSKSGQYGENLHWSWGSPSFTYSAAAASDKWYSEIENYDFYNGRAFDSTKPINHFTAMVWNGVTRVGFGFARTSEYSGEGLYVVANYSPAPNYPGQYTTNVFRPN